MFLHIANPLNLSEVCWSLFHVFLFIVSHTAWVIIFTHGNKSSKLDKKVSFVGLRETTYTPVHASSYGHGPFYQAKIADGRSESLQWISATATERLPSAILRFELFLLSCQNVVGRWVLVIAVLGIAHGLTAGTMPCGHVCSFAFSSVCLVVGLWGIGSESLYSTRGIGRAVARVMGNL
jgi:hypothetical protein